jgi:hypothetical protein
MACEYESITVFEKFKDLKTLEKALVRVGREGYRVNGLKVEADAVNMGRLKQAYQTEAVKAGLKARGIWATEKTDAAGKITLTVRA